MAHVVCDVTSIDSILKMILALDQRRSCHLDEASEVDGIEPTEAFADLAYGGSRAFSKLFAKRLVVRERT